MPHSARTAASFPSASRWGARIKGKAGGRQRAHYASILFGLLARPDLQSEDGPTYATASLRQRIRGIGDTMGESCEEGARRPALDAASSYGPSAELRGYPASCQAVMPPSRFQTLL
jgi:hypothetical protein